MMNRHELIDEFHSRHLSLLQFTEGLNDAQFYRSAGGKWSASQQLEHIALCLAPIDAALAAKSMLAEKFGTIDRPQKSFSEIIRWYKEALEKGGKAPEKFVPGSGGQASRAEQRRQVLEAVESVCRRLDTCSEAELDTLSLPHPLLGKLSLREMGYLMAYHATHHQLQVEKSLPALSNMA